VGVDWYENIEEGLREVVRLLRDNGVNTTYSCHHAMIVEAENYEDEDLLRIYNLLIESGHDGFTIEMIAYKEHGQRLARHLRLKFHKCPGCGT
jgi:hypothetical protein